MKARRMHGYLSIIQHFLHLRKVFGEKIDKKIQDGFRSGGMTLTNGGKLCIIGLVNRPVGGFFYHGEKL